MCIYICKSSVKDVIKNLQSNEYSAQINIDIQSKLLLDRNKLECLRSSLAGLSSLGSYLKVRLVPFSCSTVGQALGLNHKHQTRLERLARDKISSLLSIFVDYERKKFCNIWYCRNHLANFSLRCKGLTVDGNRNALAYFTIVIPAVA